MHTPKKTQMKRWIVVAIGTLLAMGAVLRIPARKVRAAGPTYTTIDCPGFSLTLGTDINDSGQIVGECLVSLKTRQGFLLNHGVFTPIIYPGAPFTRAVGINRYGDIVGDYDLDANNGNGQDFGFLLKGVLFTQVRFPNSDSTVPAGINANDDIVGWYLDKVGMHGFLFSGGNYTSIDFPGAPAYTQAWKVNDYGEIVGRYKGATDGKFHMFVLSNGSFTAIPDEPDAFETAVVEDGGLNGSGAIVSQYHSVKSCGLLTSVGCLHGFLLSGGVFTTIDVPGATETLALGINSSGDIVGGYQDANGGFHAYLRTP